MGFCLRVAHLSVQKLPRVRGFSKGFTVSMVFKTADDATRNRGFLRHVGSFCLDYPKSFRVLVWKGSLMHRGLSKSFVCMVAGAGDPVLASFGI